MLISIQIPKSEKFHLKKGDKVDFNTPFVSLKNSKKTRVALAQLLGFSPQSIYKFLKKNLGDKVEIGDVLAEEKNFVKSKKFLSQVDGTVTQIDDVEGSIVIENISDDEYFLNCYFQGEVHDVFDTYLDLKVAHSHKVKVKEALKATGAPLYYDFKEKNNIVEDDVLGKFVVADEISPIDQSKLKTLGAKGVVSHKKFDNLSLLQTILETPQELEHVLSKKYKFIISSPEQNTVIFYE